MLIYIQMYTYKVYFCLHLAPFYIKFIPKPLLPINLAWSWALGIVPYTINKIHTPNPQCNTLQGGGKKPSKKNYQRVLKHCFHFFFFLKLVTAIIIYFISIKHSVYAFFFLVYSLLSCNSSYCYISIAQFTGV